MMEMPQTLVTRTSLRRDLASLGVQRGDSLCVHSSLKKLGFVIGGVRTVVEALQDAVGPEGTIMMPAYSGDLSDPAEWKYPPVPEDWISQIRAETPPYDPVLTPTRSLGAVPEYFRRHPGVVRSAHPQSSFAALGARARELTAGHELAFRFGPKSPLGRLMEMNGKVLMLAAPWDTISFLYLCLFSLGDRPRVQKRAPMIVEGRPQWVEYEDIVYTADWFIPAAEELVARGLGQVGLTGASRSLLFSTREAFPALEEFCRRALA